MVTVEGHFGMSSRFAQRNDRICIVYGCSIPVILRPNADSNTYTFLGKSYVHGVTEGGAMKWLEEGKCTLEIFTIT